MSLRKLIDYDQTKEHSIFNTYRFWKIKTIKFQALNLCDKFLVLQFYLRVPDRQHDSSI